jgi:flagellar hook-basal body complex protein FliE
MASPITAANAYANLAKLTSAGTGTGNSFNSLGTGNSQADGTSFGAMVKEALGSVMDAGRKSDAQTVAMASGKANVMDVVTAVAETDVAVSTLVSVRDRVIQSYEDIMKMAI